MTEEQQDLLLKDLSMRLPYGVKVQYENEIFDIEYVCPMYGEIKLDNHETWTLNIEEVKPYLFPLSSMTDEQNIEYLSTCKGGNAYCSTFQTFDWLNKNHFDYRGLIPMGLAEDATGLNIYAE